MADPLPRFVSLEVAKVELGLPPGPDPDPDNPNTDEILGRLLDYCTKKFQDKAGWPIFSGNQIHRIDGGFRTDLWPAATPITAVNSLTDWGVPILPADGSSSGYEFDADRVWLVSGTFSEGKQNVALNYVGGYAADAIPGDIVEVNIEQMRYMWLRRMNIAQASQSLAGQSVPWERVPLIPRFLECAEAYSNKAWMG